MIFTVAVNVIVLFISPKPVGLFYKQPGNFLFTKYGLCSKLVNRKLKIYKNLKLHYWFTTYGSEK